MADDFRMDPAGIRKVLGEAMAVAAQREKAAAVVEDAKRTGHKNPAHSKHIVDGYKVGPTTVTANGAETQIVNDDWRWRFHEFGNANHPPYRSVTRAAENAGLTVKDARQ